jgi:hypothetical protein
MWFGHHRLGGGSTGAGNEGDGGGESTSATSSDAPTFAKQSNRGVVPTALALWVVFVLVSFHHSASLLQSSQTLSGSKANLRSSLGRIGSTTPPRTTTIVQTKAASTVNLDFSASTFESTGTGSIHENHNKLVRCLFTLLAVTRFFGSCVGV